jgi:hypothetical protein
MTRTRAALDSLDVDSPTFATDYNRIYDSICAEIVAAYRRSGTGPAQWKSVCERYGESLIECALCLIIPPRS